MKRWSFFVGFSIAWVLLEILSCSSFCCFKERVVGEVWCGMPLMAVLSKFFSRNEKPETQESLGDKNEDKSPKVKKGKEYKVFIPEEKLVEATTEIKGKPFVCILNVGLLDLKPKAAFSWYLSLILDYGLPEGKDMPDREDVEKMQDFIDNLSEKLAEDKDHPNALVLGRATGDGMTHAMWYVNNPEKANDYLQGVISSGDYPFHFEFMMQQDKKWEEAEYWLKPIK